MVLIVFSYCVILPEMFYISEQDMNFYLRDPSKSDAFDKYQPGNYGSFRTTIQTFYAIF